MGLVAARGVRGWPIGSRGSEDETALRKDAPYMYTYTKRSSFVNQLNVVSLAQFDTNQRASWLPKEQHAARIQAQRRSSSRPHD